MKKPELYQSIYIRMANPRFNRALKDLCEIMNEEEFMHPRTRLKMVFDAPVVASVITPGQEL
jgi:hypothetical protein